MLGFLIVFAMAVALYFLIRSMNKQLRKVGADKRTFVDAGEQVDAAPNGAQKDLKN